MPTTVVAWSTALVSAIWVAESLLNRGRPQHRPDARTPRSWLQGWPQAATLLFAIFSAAALLFSVGTLDFGSWGLLLQLPGFLLVVAATVVALRTKVEMRDQFTNAVQVWSGQRLSTRGIFSLVRHPLYMATIGIWIGAGLGMLSWLLIVTGVGVVLPTFYLRAALEEKLILDHFGPQYRNYQSQVPMLFPWQRSRPGFEPPQVPEVIDQPNVAQQE